MWQSDISMYFRYRSVTWKFLIILLIAVSSTPLQLDEKDLYKLLGVPRDADSRAIRKAFKELAVKYHPDKNTVTCQEFDMCIGVKLSVIIFSRKIRTLRPSL